MGPSSQCNAGIPETLPVDASAFLGTQVGVAGGYQWFPFCPCQYVPCGWGQLLWLRLVVGLISGAFVWPGPHELEFVDVTAGHAKLPPFIFRLAFIML